nr:hypothetical protein [Candidatus Sigynarchaeota archaeon]
NEVIISQKKIFETSTDAYEKITGTIVSVKAKVDEHDKSGEFDKAEELEKQVLEMRAEAKKYQAKIDECLDIIAKNVDDMLKHQEITTSTLQTRLSSDWERIKGYWEAYKAKKTTLKEMFKRISSELGKRLMWNVISAITGGFVSIR